MVFSEESFEAVRKEVALTDGPEIADAVVERLRERIMALVTPTVVTGIDPVRLDDAVIEGREAGTSDEALFACITSMCRKFGDGMQFHTAILNGELYYVVGQYSRDVFVPIKASRRVDDLHLYMHGLQAGLHSMRMLMVDDLFPNEWRGKIMQSIVDAEAASVPEIDVKGVIEEVKRGG